MRCSLLLSFSPLSSRVWGETTPREGESGDNSHIGIAGVTVHSHVHYSRKGGSMSEAAEVLNVSLRGTEYHLG